MSLLLNIDLVIVIIVIGMFVVLVLVFSCYPAFSTYGCRCSPCCYDLVTTVVRSSGHICCSIVAIRIVVTVMIFRAFGDLVQGDLPDKFLEER